ncbi:MAG: hypothetical protein LBI80_05570 [Endomicrobium sp.]|jgi:3-hydroxybutyryl-CoA dehydratase|nr:hypothetical protein [Endomicrobium sp.]
MNTFSFSEIFLGQKEEFRTKITEKWINAFRSFTRDDNPLHKNDDFAKNKGFPKKVVFGMLVASFYSTLCGVYIPGEKCIIHSIDCKFYKPAFTNDNICVEGEVTEKDDRFNIVKIKAKISRIEEDGTLERLSGAYITAGVI